MYNYKARVDKVVDGDTIDLTIDLGFDTYTKQRVRLFGVDCPETRTRNTEEKKAGLKAKDFVWRTIDGKDVTVTTNEKGKFGRYLATIIYEDDTVEININKALIELGLAVEYFGGKKKGFDNGRSKEKARREEESVPGEPIKFYT